MTNGRFESLMRCHPFEELEVVRAEGVSLWDSEGRRYLDFESGIWCMSLGHNHPAVTSAARAQMERVVHLGPRFTGPGAAAAAEKLLGVVPPPAGGRVVFLSSGSEAVDLAIRISRAFTGKRGVVTLASSFLGAIGEGAVASASAGAAIQGVRGSPGATDVTVVEEGGERGDGAPPEHGRDRERGWGRAAETAACLLVEPVMASAGVRIPDTSVVLELARLVRAAGGLVVVDEVTTGLGRVGSWFGFEHHGLQPDVIALGKALGNGFPVSAVVVSPRIEAALAERRFTHVQSHQNDPFGCAVAGAVIDEMRRCDLPGAARRLGGHLGSRLKELQGRLPGAVAGVRGLGLLWAVELAAEVPVEAVWRRLLQSGVILGIRPDLRILRLAPPLIASRHDVDEACDRLRECLAACL